MRIVVFSRPYITQELLHKGIVERRFSYVSHPPRTFYDEDNLIFRLDDGRTVICDSKDVDKLIAYRVSTSEILEPLHGIHSLLFCGEWCPMSVATIYRASTYFFSYLGLEGYDIIELEVPDEDILVTRQVANHKEVILARMKKKWVVSILHFKGYVNEPVCGENALYYRNEVLKNDTYHMCYSPDIVFNGHGHGDLIEYCMSPELVDSGDVTVQEAYVQPEICNLFKRYWYCIVHGISIEDINSVPMSRVNKEIPNSVPEALIETFRTWECKLLELYGIMAKDTSLKYKDRWMLIERR